MQTPVEVLAPGGDVDSIKAAIFAGAGAVYCGLQKFNARNSAQNISFDELVGVINLAHSKNCKIFLTLNIVILEQEIPDLFRLLNRVVNTKVDGIIVQDFGLFYLLKKYFKSLEVHASTQVNTHNTAQVSFLNRYNVSRVNLARELNLGEIELITEFAHSNGIETEVFVHGSYCIGFSGLCYISSLHGGNSGNRGRCAQPCRDQYQQTEKNREYPLNLKDNSAFFNIKDLMKAQVDSFKIEGRIKNIDYVYTVVSNFKKQIESLEDQGVTLQDNSSLYKVFNRDFSNGYLKDNLTKEMFIDNPRTHVLNHFAQDLEKESIENISKLKEALYEEKNKLFSFIKKGIKDFNINKINLSLSFYGEKNKPLEVIVKILENEFSVFSTECLTYSLKYSIDLESLKKRFLALNNDEFEIDEFNLEKLDENLFISFRDLSLLKKKIAFILNENKGPILEVDVPFLNINHSFNLPSKLSVLISSEKDLNLSENNEIDLYFQLPESMESQYDEILELFINNPSLIAWFSPIITNESLQASFHFLETLNPNIIITNNSAIAYRAFELGINWIAGPSFNVTNSFTLLSFQEIFNCVGSFISNEIKKNQIKYISCPERFRLFYSLYHPISLLISKQCLFLTTSGCEKGQIDSDCIKNCQKRTEIINTKDVSFIIDKKKGSHNRMYSNKNFFNPEVISDLHGSFSDYFIDLSDVRTDTQLLCSKERLILNFQDLLHGKDKSIEKLQEMIISTINNQYTKGL